MMSGQGVPVGDLWRLPDGSFRPMTPDQIFINDAMMKLFGGGKAAESAKTLEGHRTALSDALKRQ